MTTKANGKQEEALLSSAWDYLRECERQYAVSVAVELIPQNRRQVWLLHLLASDLRPGANFNRPVARYRVEYPNAHLATFSGTLLQAMLKLDSMCHEYREREGPRDEKEAGS